MHAVAPAASDLVRRATVVRVANDQISCALAGQHTVLSLKTGLYYCLDPVGARVWTLIQQPCSVGAVLDTLFEEFDVEPEQCEKDLTTLLETLRAQQLINME